MKAAVLFRFRVPIFLLLFLLGFLAPWERWFDGVRGTLWLTASALLARTGWMGLGKATLVVTLLALASLTLGAALRVWGTAYLGSAAMRGAHLQGASIIAAGPYRFVRNPLYLGSSLVAVGTSLLMPVAGALFFLPALLAYTLLLILVEERFLTATGGAPYRDYCRQVPRLLPHLFSGFAAPGATAPTHPQWLVAIFAETYPVAFTLCFAVFAWRYNAHILIQCAIVCYGLSLVVRALLKESRPASTVA